MWIIPSNHPLYSAFAQECVASKEDLSELLVEYGNITTQVPINENEEGPVKTKTVVVSALPLFWKSKPLSATIWLSKWNKVYWLPRLFGRTLKLSQQSNFTEKYTESLADI